MVMDYHDGGTLYAFIRELRHKMTEDMFLCFMEQIAHGVQVFIPYKDINKHQQSHCQMHSYQYRLGQPAATIASGSDWGETSFFQ